MLCGLCRGRASTSRERHQGAVPALRDLENDLPKRKSEAGGVPHADLHALPVRHVPHGRHDPRLLGPPTTVLNTMAVVAAAVADAAAAIFIALVDATETAIVFRVRSRPVQDEMRRAPVVLHLALPHDHGVGIHRKNEATDILGEDVGAHDDVPLDRQQAPPGIAQCCGRWGVQQRMVGTRDVQLSDRRNPLADLARVKELFLVQIHGKPWLASLRLKHADGGPGAARNGVGGARQDRTHFEILQNR
eukprot:9485673-Pyramimonas_sp.AAC.2